MPYSVSESAVEFVQSRMNLAQTDCQNGHKNEVPKYEFHNYNYWCYLVEISIFVKVAL